MAFALIWTGAMFYLWRISALRRELEVKVDRLTEQLETRKEQ
jgi:hypothetical protein